MKKLLAMTMAAALMVGALAGCGDSSGTSSTGTGTQDGFDLSQTITVVSREDGSGTRGAFIELTGVEAVNASGDKEDFTTVDATISNSTNNVMQTVAADETAIGYISMGSLNDSVKAVTVDGVEATAANVKDGSYALARPFNIVTSGGISELAQDFIDYIMSAEGQAVVSDNGYIGDDSAPAYAGAKPGGKLVVGGSSSVTPVMEKLIEAYKAVNTGAEIELQTTDSTTGVNQAIDGTCDIGMASRELKESELQAGAVSTAIAMDGIAVVVNNANSIQNLATDTIRAIYVGELTTWADAE